MSFYGWDETQALALPSVMRRLLQWLQTHHAENAQLPLL
jgi:hypothetical protein